jgi:hypothetical protein
MAYSFGSSLLVPTMAGADEPGMPKTGIIKRVGENII